MIVTNKKTGADVTHISILLLEGKITKEQFKNQVDNETN